MYIPAILTMASYTGYCPYLGHGDIQPKNFPGVFSLHPLLCLFIKISNAANRQNALKSLVTTTFCPLHQDKFARHGDI